MEIIYFIIRGGSWYNGPQNLRSAFRYYDTPDNRYTILGFRLVRTASNPEHSYPITLDSKSERALKVAREALIKIEEILEEKE